MDDLENINESKNDTASAMKSTNIESIMQEIKAVFN